MLFTLACAVLLTGAAAAPAGTGGPALGVYTGPGPKALPGAAAFSRWSGYPVVQILDFLPSGTWAEIARPFWLLDPHAAGGTPLVLSVPLIPDDPSATLATCADGGYDKHWVELARNLVSSGLGDTVLRPGWEFNGDWYRWSAAGQEQLFAECFRHFVRSARKPAGQRFTFDWNPNLGAGAFPAERAYPGDSYVDYIGVDVYDASWAHYPPTDGTTIEAARGQAWDEILSGDHGLRFWSEFARARDKPMSIPEWGVTWRADGHGGGDNPDFVESMLRFITDPGNRVAYANYFNSPDTPELAHDLSRRGTRFPRSGAQFRALVTQLPRPGPAGDALSR